MVSATVGSVGATSAQIPASWWVRNDFSEMGVQVRGLRGVVDGAGGEQAQHHGDVPEVQVQVDQGDLGAGGGEGDGEVGGQEGLAAAALGAEHGDDPAGGAILPRLGGDAAGQAPAQGPGDLQRPGRRGARGGGVAGGRQDVLDPDPQGVAQQLAGLLLADQQHRHVGGALLQPAGQGERVAVGQGGADQRGQHRPALGGHRGHGLVGTGHPDRPPGQPGQGVRQQVP
jgi:hypothetical protein